MAQIIDSPTRENLRKLASLKQWMGPSYYATLLATVQSGLMSATAVNKNDVPPSIVRFRNAIGMVKDWEEERPKWGLD